MSSSRQRPTLAAVAEATGYSTSTVSRALRQDPRVTPSTRERIAATAADLGFTQNALASNLRRGRASSLVGIIVPEVHDPFFAAVASSVQRAAMEHGLELILASHNNDNGEQARLVGQMVGHRVEAIILVPAPGKIPAQLRQEARFGTPIVCLDRPATVLECDSIVPDNQGGAAKLAAELLRRGHTRFAVVCLNLGVWTQRERLRAVEDTLGEAGLELSSEAVVSSAMDDTIDEVEMGRMLVREQPTAVIGLSVLPLVAALRCLRRHGLTADLACFDGHPLFDLLPQPVLCVEQDPGEIGRLAMEKVRQWQEPQHHAGITVLPVKGPFITGGDPA